MVGKNRMDDVVCRVDDTHVVIKNSFGIPITLLARPEVDIEPEGVAQLLEFASLETTLEQIHAWEKAGRTGAFFGEAKGHIEQILLTPDFHKGSGIPVGTVVDARGIVIPRAVGNDICCGMRLLVTDVTRDELAPHLDAIKPVLRAIFFQGKRNIPMSPHQREALLRDGLSGLFATSKENAGTGLWQFYDRQEQERDLLHTHCGGSLSTRGTFAFDAWIRASGAKDGRDVQIGSVGGGNHFVELQTVEELIDGPTAYSFGLSRNLVTVMAHSGSVGLGHMVGGYFCERAASIYPRGVPHPKHGFHFLPTRGPLSSEASAYLDAMRNAANFAFGNRLFLGLMAIRALSETLGRKVGARLVYDAPHNLIWGLEEKSAGYLHRKGATPALGVDSQDGPFAYTGHPVIIPGSMGASSYVLAGQGNASALFSACHGAGRCLTRGRSSHVDDTVYERTMERLRVVTPIDPMSPAVRSRRDILAKYHQRMKEEAPFAYKPITPVVQTIEEAGVARRVARLAPLLTVKG